MIQHLPIPDWSKELLRLGAVSAIALGLVYWLAQSQDRKLNDLIGMAQAHESNRSTDMKLMNAFLYAACLNAADGLNGPKQEMAVARCAVALDGALELQRSR